MVSNLTVQLEVAEVVASKLENGTAKLDELAAAADELADISGSAANEKFCGADHIGPLLPSSG